jgi:formate C-acetyltransferase|tara:strand:- start:1500 stop:3833 length:2334 start_codon:yes stop_codon:yes gene_type:complete
MNAPATFAQMRESSYTSRPTARIDRMRKQFFSTKPTFSITRARIEGRIMRETQAEPMITRKAKIFAAIVREMPIDVYADELIVGYSSDRPRCHNISPGTLNADQLTKADESGGHTNRMGLSDEEVRELQEDLIPLWTEQGRNGGLWHYGHNIHGLENVVKKGFVGIKRQAEDRLASLDLTEPDDMKKVPFLQGVVMAMQAAGEMGGRYAAKARDRAAEETDPERQAELLEIADICERVPLKPAETFKEALQSYYTAWLMLTMELSLNIAFALGRMDQYLYPYYVKDISEGRITDEEVQELLDCFIAKLNLTSGIGSQSTSGSIGVGGVKADGNDATNELTYMFIEAMKHTNMADPWFAVFVHSKSPEPLLIKAAELTASGGAHPQYLSSDVGISQCLARGNMGGPMVTLADARNSSNVGCLELVIPGKDSGYLYIGGHNLAAALELALNNGVRRSDNKQIGVETGDARTFQSFAEVQEAFKKQVAWMRRNTQIGGNAQEQRIMDLHPTVYESALIEGCIEKGLCREHGGAHYNFNTGGTEVGSSDAGDSMTAIKKLVFDDKQITMAELCDALDANFDGHDKIRRMCLGVPNFGNDDDEADTQKAWVLHQWASEYQQLKNLRGGYGCPGGSSMSSYVPQGKVVGALPSGRLSGEPLAAAASPCAGKDVKGVTAVLNSMGKVDGVEILGGLSLTCRIDGSVFNSREGIKRIADLVRTFVDQQIFHLQLNVTSSETMRAAQADPESYADLMVKVAGYNAYFTQQSKDLQDSIIARTEHGL